MMKHCLLWITTCICLITAPLVQAGAYSKYKVHNDYDDYFRKYTKRFFGPAFDWHYFKAQAVAESNLNPEAKSYVGAQGIMQIMPRTYEEIKTKNQFIEGLATEPKWNIAAGIWYNQQHFEFWKKGRTLEERLKFMYGSYNAGRKNLLRAQRKAIDAGLNPLIWQSMYQALPTVTGAHSKETLNYVEKIFTIKEDIQ
ncbi:putative soluble lytic transglycosylase fused to an ABC-type amino acid-binding protein [Gynuella sunshinyii YC6258]|uniref:Putative soluble lytic transglycosylase fused to an ABC-type amino acid-binding protein n=2 Tax=Gynuella sunshinyii TaxID=1445505 RepID=A0A0C5VYR2_9GAMM|nr:putative soluble lytic transglycosylase fused to an ABC-type amino acid-binding protein [Gynuella sunshinyii YC6258]